MATRDTYQRVGRPSVLKGLTTQLATRPPLNKMDRPARPVILRDRDDDAAEIDRVARMLGVDSPDDWQRIRELQNELERQGITDVRDLRAQLGDDDRGYANGWHPPALPAPSLSPLYSDVEIVDMVKNDSRIVSIPSVAISSTTTLTLPNLPMKWQMTDFTCDLDVASSGSSKLVELRVVLGTSTIMQFRLSQLARQVNTTMIFDALQKVYSYEIGPSSALKVEIQNLNSGVGQTLENGWIQYTYRPIVDATSAAVLRASGVRL